MGIQTLAKRLPCSGFSRGLQIMPAIMAARRNSKWCAEMRLRTLGCTVVLETNAGSFKVVVRRECGRCYKATFLKHCWEIPVPFTALLRTVRLGKKALASVATTFCHMLSSSLWLFNIRAWNFIRKIRVWVCVHMTACCWSRTLTHICCLQNELDTCIWDRSVIFCVFPFLLFPLKYWYSLLTKPLWDSTYHSRSILLDCLYISLI